MVHLLRRVVVAVLLTVWFFPGQVLSAPSAPTASKPAAAARAETTAPVSGSAEESRRYAEREKQAQGLEQFEGGQGGGIYIGSGVLVVILLVLLILLLI